MMNVKGLACARNDQFLAPTPTLVSSLLCTVLFYQWQILPVCKVKEEVCCESGAQHRRC